MRFTRQALADIQVPVGKDSVLRWDDTLPGFGVRVSAGGARTFIVQFRNAAGQTKRMTVGRVDALSLDEARRDARSTLAKVQLGTDAHAERAEARARAAVTVGRVVDRYLAAIAGRLRDRTVEEATRYLKTHWSPLADLPLHGVRRADVAARLGEIATKNGPSAANRARATLSAFYAWAIGAGLVDMNPVVGTNRPADEVSRDHVMTDGEITAVWNACRDDDHGRAVRLLLLTGQRRDEVGDMTWSEVDLDRAMWTIPAARAKNGRTHDVPLSPAAVDVLRSMTRQDGRDLVFGSGKGGFSGWSKSKAELDARIAKAGAVVRPWRLHDLRRTAATRMADLGTLPHVVEAVLNHVSGHRAGVAGVYNRASYGPEKRTALEAWSDRVDAMVQPPVAAA